MNRRGADITIILLSPDFNYVSYVLDMMKPPSTIVEENHLVGMQVDAVLS